MGVPVRPSLAFLLLASCAAPTTAPMAPAGPLGPFDGEWQTTLSCEPARDALGYSFRFVSTVRNGHLRGAQGVEGQPSSVVLEGTIAADGTAALYAKGRTGSREYVPGRDTPRGTEYGYSVNARFDQTSGSGTRVEGRPCSLRFVRQ